MNVANYSEIKIELVSIHKEKSAYIDLYYERTYNGGFAVSYRIVNHESGKSWDYLDPVNVLVGLEEVIKFTELEEFINFAINLSNGMKELYAPVQLREVVVRF